MADKAKMDAISKYPEDLMEGEQVSRVRAKGGPWHPMTMSKMPAPNLSPQDKKDLDKFAKHLVYMCIQIIVQSRLGEKIQTHTKSFSARSDWFNLGVVDIPEVKAETVKVFNGNLTVGQNICVDISLKTAEGKTMILETWWLTLLDECHPDVRVSHTVYNKMVVLLKLLFSISRETMAYRLSRKQGPDNFVVCYRIYMGEPQIFQLGKGYQKLRVGGVPTPIGTYSLSMAYRTKMQILPHTSTKDLCEDLQENHFNMEASPKEVDNLPCFTNYRDRRNSSDTDEVLIFGDPEDVCAATFTSSPSDGYLCSGGYDTTPPHGSPQRKRFGSGTHDEETKENIHRNSSDTDEVLIFGDPEDVCATTFTSSPSDGYLCSGGYGTTPPHGSPQRKRFGSGTHDEENKENIHSRSLKCSSCTTERMLLVCPFAPYTSKGSNLAENDKYHPFNRLLQYPHYDINTNAQAKASSEGGDTSQEDRVDAKMSDMTSRTGRTGSLSTGNQSTHKTHRQGSSAPEDLVMVELNTPFASPKDSDLDRFYQDCLVAPPLAMFQETVTVQETLNSITEQLAMFDAKALVFDEFVKGLKVSEG